MRTIDVLINSASRLDCLIPTVESMREKLITTGKFRIILHDDVVKKEESKKIEQWALSSGIIDVFLKTAPAKRLGPAIMKCLPLIETEFFIRWEDDWLFLKEVNLDEILDIMQKNPHINQVSFNQSGNESDKHGVVRPVFTDDRIKLTQVQEWVIGPGIWRLSFIKPKWTPSSDANDIITILGTVDAAKYRDMEWMKNNVGCYFYGGHGAGPYIKHLGIGGLIRWHSAIEK